jgi:two-component system, cell cycle sensor histidine kinase and response regulator CckA
METIFLVDDEAEIVVAAREILEGQGYRILFALNAEEALRVAAAHAGPIHLLLTDVAIPGASGQVLARQLTLQRAEIKVLYMSGFVLLERQQQFSEEFGGPIILKPFTIERLTEKVPAVLNAKPASPFDRPADPWRST